MPLLGRIAVTPVRIQFEQRRNAEQDVYRRGDTLCKQIFVWRRVFIPPPPNQSVCQQQAGKVLIDHPFYLGWAIIRRRR